MRVALHNVQGSNVPDRYVLDANVFIEPHQRFYGFDICPGYWTALKRLNQASSICSIDKVRKELLAQDDALSDWVKDLDLPDFFKQTSDQAVIRQYRDMIAWVQANPQFTNSAKAKFASAADGWLVAFAKVSRKIVVTLEVYDANIKKDVPIPNLCEQFDVPYVDLFEMLRALDVKLSLKKHA